MEIKIYEKINTTETIFLRTQFNVGGPVITISKRNLYHTS